MALTLTQLTARVQALLGHIQTVQNDIALIVERYVNADAVDADADAVDADADGENELSTQERLYTVKRRCLDAIDNLREVEAHFQRQLAELLNPLDEITAAAVQEGSI